MELRLEIDLLRLDEEWQGQPKMRHYFGCKLADAQFAMDEAKDGLNVIKAEMDAAIRADPAAYGLAKATESAIAGAVVRTELCVKAMKKANQAKHSLNILQAAVDGLEHRKRALTKLVELHGQDYFATPTMPPGLKNRDSARA